jgi:diguanylate cyclase (GGDEF)-like protein
MDEPTDRPVEAKLGSAVAGIWEKFRGATLERVATLDGAVIALLGGELESGLRREAEREAHKLAGSVGTFGFAHGSELAREIELLLGGADAISESQTLRLSELTVALREELERPIAPAPPAPRPAEARSLLLIVDEDREFTERVAMEAEGRGLKVRVAERMSDVRAALAGPAPDVVLLDPFFAGDTETGLRLVGELTTLAPGRPVLVASAAGSFSDRVEAARLGARAFLEKPLSPAVAVASALQCLQRRATVGTVLLVDDDPEILAAVGAILERAGLRVFTEEDPRAFWDTLERIRPDLLLLGFDMPRVSGVDLCRVVRNDSRWSTLPVIFLAERTDQDTVHAVFAAGADDLVAKGVVESEIVTRVLNRLERVRLYHRLADVDALTGVASRRNADESLKQLIALAARQKQPVALAVVDLDHFREVNDGYGHAVGDDVLRRVSRRLRTAVRGEDVFGRRGGQEFVIGAFGLEKQALVGRLNDVLAALRTDGIPAGAGLLSLSFSAGVAGFPADGTDLPALYRAAEAALYQAKELGRDQVVAARSGSERDSQEDVDLVLVEDDPVLAELLLHAFATHGYSARWLQDGEAAIEALQGPDPEIRARVILLDVNLPGRDGLGVLRVLARSGATGHSRVIMLTVRSTETEVVRSLELGAFDHVAKPFSVPVLLRRIHTALQKG